VRILMMGPFGLHPKGTMRARALPAARALVARGHTVRILMPPWHRPEEGGRAWQEEGVQLRYVSLAGLRLPLPLLGHLLVARRMAVQARAWKPDLIHVFKPKAYGLLAADLLRPRPCPIVVDTDDWEGPGGWNDLEPYPFWQRAAFAWQERHGLRTADHVTVASRALHGLTWALGVPPAKVSYLPNGIDLAHVESMAGDGAVDGKADGDGGSKGDDDLNRPGDSGRGPRLLLYTRFFEFPVERPIALLARIRERHPDARLVVVGRGLFGEEAALRAAAARAGVAEAVEEHGWLEPPDARRVFAGCDVALYPFDDTLVNRTKSSVKLLELLAAGLPVVAEAVGQNAVVIEDGRSGRLVPSGDEVAFSEAVLALLADPVARDALGLGARQRVGETFAWPVLAEELEQIYARVLDRE